VRERPAPVHRADHEQHDHAHQPAADAGEDPPLQAQPELVQRIRDIIAERKLTQAEAAELLGLDQPKVSALVRGRVEGYSLDRLFRLLNVLGQRVEISVRPNAAGAKSRAVVVTCEAMRGSTF
jgi:predicted XRE-type DNA-binding protein